MRIVPAPDVPPASVAPGAQLAPGAPPSPGGPSGDDAALNAAMARLTDGDRGALRLVHDGVRGPMLRAAERLLGVGADAEDATQNALQKLFLQSADFDRRRRVVPWAVALAIFEARTLRRKVQRRKIDALDTGRFQVLASGAGLADEALERAELLRLAADLVGELSEADRDTIVEVLAEREDGRGGAFRKRKQRAVERLREAWRLMHGDQ